ncbi:unnamed protein product [Sympodiomycopsis kandeliae]
MTDNASSPSQPTHDRPQSMLSGYSQSRKDYYDPETVVAHHHNDSKKPDVAVTSHEAQHLADLGYKAELPRNLKLTTILGLSFSIIAAPFGLSIGSMFALVNGGAPTFFFGWVLLSVITLAMAASLGELCSVWPTSGGVYVWSANLSSAKYRRVVGFCTGWVNFVANITLSLSIAFGWTQLILGAAGLWKSDDWTPTPWQTVLTFWAVMLVCTIINLFGVKGRYLDALNTASMYWTGAVVIIILIAVLAKSASTVPRRSAHDAFVLFQNSSGWPDGWSFFVGCLNAAYTLTGYGLCAQLCEEVSNPEVAVPRAMVGSIYAASLTGFLFILPIIFVLPQDISPLLDSGSGPIPALFKIVMNSNGGAFGLTFLLLGIGFFAAVGGLTVALRCTWAFSRDNGLPFSSTWSKVNKTLDIPINATIVTSILISLLGLIYLGSPAAFSAFTGAATICLGISYAVPIGISLLSRRKYVKNASWNLGTMLGYAANLLAVSWIIFSIILFSFPTTKTTSPENLNYASVVFCFFFGFAALYYVVWAKKTYTGPPLPATS